LSDTYLVCGLGNPGSKYKFTRHNVGFLTLDKLALNLNETINKKMFKGLYTDARINNKKVVILQPQTYMNLSGECIAHFKEYYKIEIENIIVVCDDINLKPGNLRIRKSGGAGGHNGLKSIIALLGTQDFMRVRIGVGGGGLSSTSGHVLGNFAEDEFKIISEIVEESVLAVNEIIYSNLDNAMNKFNRKLDT